MGSDFCRLSFQRIRCLRPKRHGPVAGPGIISPMAYILQCCMVEFIDLNLSFSQCYAQVFNPNPFKVRVMPTAENTTSAYGFPGLCCFYPPPCHFFPGRCIHRLNRSGGIYPPCLLFLNFEPFHALTLLHPQAEQHGHEFHQCYLCAYGI